LTDIGGIAGHESDGQKDLADVENECVEKEAQILEVGQMSFGRRDSGGSGPQGDESEEKESDGQGKEGDRSAESALVEPSTGIGFQEEDHEGKGDGRDFGKERTREEQERQGIVDLFLVPIPQEKQIADQRRQEKKREQEVFPTLDPSDGFDMQGMDAEQQRGDETKPDVAADQKDKKID
jgi:hypothetical protein